MVKKYNQIKSYVIFILYIIFVAITTPIWVYSYTSREDVRNSYDGIKTWKNRKLFDK